jgi:hypothetical protein
MVVASYDWPQAQSRPRVSDSLSRSWATCSSVRAATALPTCGVSLYSSKRRAPWPFIQLPSGKRHTLDCRLAHTFRRKYNQVEIADEGGLEGSPFLAI